MTRLSVLMPVKGNEKYVHSAVHTTLLSMPKHSELLVHIDGENPELSRLLGKVNDSRLKTTSSGKSLGVASSLNHLAGIAKGEFLARMDSDDLCLPWRFSFQLKQMEKNSSDLFFGTCIVFGGKLRPLPIIPQLPLSLDDGEFKRMLLVHNPGVHPTLMIRREAFESLGGYNRVPEEDLDLWLRAASAGFNFRRTGLPLILYRFHPNQLTNSRNWQRLVETDNQIALRRDELAHSLGFKSVSDASKQILNNFKETRPFVIFEISGLPQFLRNWKTASIRKDAI